MRLIKHKVTIHIKHNTVTSDKTGNASLLLNCVRQLKGDEVGTVRGQKRSMGTTGDLERKYRVHQGGQDLLVDKCKGQTVPHITNSLLTNPCTMYLMQTPSTNNSCQI